MENPPDLVLRTTYYFISYVGSRLATRIKDIRNQFFHGMIKEHPLDYIMNLNKRNKNLKGYDRAFGDFILISWEDVTFFIESLSEEEREKYEKELLIERGGENEI